ncbi:MULTISPECIES: AbrB/MazE/SpoVT family DNA-binding domain-containing protein [unclassified Methanoculleus]|jgi:antitoxin component of MazEF toxin-antitoxin module|uniref:AbrB/MazE/SpoVT family DNA-binding domain-containing protein n=1 Tax=unclassified Methanoculleus TaxID=2619537 RepID=UPI00262779B0|nr:AbrB/MazE/SpoVT family DNA-binding domain-containing protein [Methanoculleus sp.]MDI6867854.1 AbrB/MazE/SpoVT family DNA-binding domain-containing protein [Methanoculleus sp.]
MERVATRKLQRLGGSNYVSLPAAWVKQNSLKEGDPVDISLERGRLVITATGVQGDGT